MVTVVLLLRESTTAESGPRITNMEKQSLKRGAQSLSIHMYQVELSRSLRVLSGNRFEGEGMAAKVLFRSISSRKWSCIDTGKTPL